MKLVVNKCYGGFSLSPAAVKRLAELQGKECYFFEYNYDDKTYTLAKNVDNKRSFSYTAFDVMEVPFKSGTKAFNDFWSKHSISSRDIERNDPLLVQVVEELKEQANGECAQLSVVEIPDDVVFTIEEYDGNEWVAEEHRRW